MHELGLKSIPFCYRGDVSTAKSIIKAMERRPQIFDMNCVDPLGRSALIIAVENENRDMIEMLLETGIKIKDALLVAIRYRMEELQGECQEIAVHRQKRLMSFPSPAGMSLTKLRLGRNKLVMTSLISPRESFVVTSRLGTGNSRTFFYGLS
jgi:hypothetical protein